MEGCDASSSDYVNMPRKPFRHEIHVPPPAVVRQAVDEQRATGARALERVEDALERIAGTKLAHASRARTWGEHPDERVPMAMLEAHRTRRILGRRGAGLAAPLVNAAMARAEREGVVWTPILDRAARIGVWSTYSGARASSKEWAGLMADWVRKQSEPAQLRELLEFGAEVVWSLVARQARVLDGGMFERILRRPGGAAVLAENPALSDEQVERMAHWVLEQVEGWSVRSTQPESRTLSTLTTLLGQRGWTPSGEFRKALTELARDDGDWARRSQALKCLLALGGHVSVETFLEIGSEQPLPADIADALVRRIGMDQREPLLRLARQTPDGQMFRTIAAGDLRQVDEVARRALASEQDETVALMLAPDVRPKHADEAFRTLVLRYMEESRAYHDHGARLGWGRLFRRAFTPRQLLVLYRLVEGDNDKVSALIKHEHAGPELWREIARSNSRPLVRLALAEDQRARQDPEVRSILLSSNAVDVVAALACDGRADEVAGLLTKLSEREDERLFSILRELSDEALVRLDPALLTPWLRSSDRDARAEAILLLGRMRSSEEQEGGARGRSR